jgi:hypothetical protein
MAEFNPLDSVRELWDLHLADRARLDNIFEYVHERRGLPRVPDDASSEVREIARMSPKNVLTLVRDTFAQNLSVVGYRSSLTGDDLPPWALWQRNRMDARQAEIYVPTLTYGCSYVAVVPGDEGASFRPRSPRQMLAAYSDPQSDEWPVVALEMWIDTVGSTRWRRGFLYTDELVYPVTLGQVLDSGGAPAMLTPTLNGQPFEHGAGVCPIVRYVNRRDAEDNIVGEVEPLLTLQQAINNVNFDRLIVSRFGAFPQKVITGWSGSSQEVLAASARRVWSFEDDTVDAKSFPAAQIEPYNALLDEMFQHVAMIAQISPSQVTGQIVNVSADALAAAEANQQRKLVAMRESFGESHEQLLRLGALIDGDTANASDDQAEVVWRDTEARSFGAVVDGVTKLVAAGVPIEQVLHLVPGISQRQIQDIVKQKKANDLFASIRGAAAAVRQDPEVAAVSERTTGPDVVAG